MSKNLSKYIASFEYFSKSLVFLSAVAGSISIASFVSVIGAPTRILGANCGLTFSFTSGFIKKFFKQQEIKRKNNKNVMLARSKLNIIESKISEALINNKISREDFESILNEENKYRDLKESIRMMNSQRSDTEETSLIQEGKKNRY